jgi:hypothetical protein
MSWFTFHAIDTKPIVAQLKRIADMMEVRLRIEHDYHMTPPTPLTSDSEPDTVTYSSDEDLAKQELIDEVKRFEAVADELDKEEESK